MDLHLLGSDTLAIAPLLLLLGVGLLIMLLDSFRVHASIPWLAGLGMLSAGAWAWLAGPSQSQVVFSGMMEAGGISPLVTLFLCLAGVFTVLFVPDYLARHDNKVNDVYALLVFAVLGMVLMANAHNLLMTFIGLETMSMCLYIFAALFKTDTRSNEAGLKYFLLGSFASAFLLFGIALVYGITGTLDLGELSTKITLLQENKALFYVASGLMLVGFLFKVAAFPFHNWTPDVYQGTPTPLAGFMATGSKMAAFVSLGIIIEKLELVSPAVDNRLATVLALTAFLTMVYGNLVAARQTNLKRMLAYSSIAHSGYVLLGLCAPVFGFQAILFYMFIYTLMNIGAFGLLGMAEQRMEDTDIESWKGLGKSSPYMAGAMAVFLFSLAGIPPLAGFMSKYQVFLSAIREDLVVLATIGILTSVVGAFYYLRVIFLMFFQTTEQPSTLNLRQKMAPATGIAVLVLLIILLGVFPSLILDPIRAAFSSDLVIEMASQP
ncbi:MAG: NADH-quinone oxidoreductase subunit N [Bacteroidia bacterium]|nr:NADH-quinone oxidoreductase subunit N [Bacteroidia bacterium]